MRASAAYAREVGALAVVYVAVAKLGLMLGAVSGFATLVWAPSGIALAALVVGGYRLWPGIAAGAFLVNLWVGAPFGVALGIGLGNTLEALLGALVLDRVPGFRRSLDRLQDALALVVPVALMSTAVSATIGVASLRWGGTLSPGHVAATWRAWWLGDTIGDLVVAPVLLTWDRKRDARSGVAPLSWEVGALIVALTVAAVTVFRLDLGGSTYVLAPPLIWAAIRFDQRGAARATLLVSAIAIASTALGHGPFVRQGLSESLFALQSFVATIAATFLLLGTVVSERRRAEAALEQANGELLRKNRDMEEVVYTIAHDLKAPLVTIAGFSGWIHADAEKRELTEMLDVVSRIERAAARMSRNLDDLLKLSRTGLAERAPEWVDVAAIVTTVIENHTAEIAEKGAVVEVSPALPQLFGDRVQIAELFENLVSNALRHGCDEGGRVVRVGGHPAGHELRYFVEDEGRGIPAAFHDQVFRLFRRLDGKGRGSGVGLTIVKRVVELHVGRIWIESPPAERRTGTRVWLAFPVPADGPG